jgi:hypothetical protein
MAPEGVRFAVRLAPRGGADRIDGVAEGVLRARVAAPAVDGAANEALMRLLARELGLHRRDVRIVVGATGRTKIVAVDGISADRLRRHWPDLET